MGEFQRRLRPCVTDPGTGGGQNRWNRGEVSGSGFLCGQSILALVLGAAWDRNRVLGSSQDAETLRWGQESVFLKPPCRSPPALCAASCGGTFTSKAVGIQWSWGYSSPDMADGKVPGGRDQRRPMGHECLCSGLLAPQLRTLHTLIPFPRPTPQGSAIRKHPHSALQGL